MADKNTNGGKYGLPQPGIPGPFRPGGGYGLPPMGMPGPQGGYSLPAPGMDKKPPRQPGEPRLS